MRAHGRPLLLLSSLLKALVQLAAASLFLWFPLRWQISAELLFLLVQFNPQLETLIFKTSTDGDWG